ncbi:MAG: trypsin-like peptidase domain-containing protein [Planctomycetota bacterium]|nr:trypsin-like peptidase domain-containing protein [Planctomycetota bacterium]
MIPLTLPAQEPLRDRSRSGLQVVEPDEQDRDLRLTPVVRAVDKAADSVVSIYINQAALAGHRRAQPEGQGSGVILDESGFVITNWHVVAPVLTNESLSLSVKLRDGRTRPARVLSTSPETDLALLQLRLNGDELVQPVQIGRSSGLMIGEDLIAIGNPQGHANTVTKGVLSATGRSIDVRTPDGRTRTYKDLLQTDAAINQGNSGGALLDITGKLVGINNAMAMGAENIGFAIPVDTVREVFENDLLTGASFAMSADSPWLGLELAERDGALVIARVVAGGPAANAGVTVGDELVGANGKPIANRVDYARSVLMGSVDSPVALRLLRDRREVEVELEPLRRSAGAILAYTGISLEVIDATEDRKLCEQVTRKFGETSPRRRLMLFPSVLRVRSVQAGSPAEQLQLKQGDILLATEFADRFGRNRDFPVDSASEFAQLCHRLQGRSLRLIILRDKEDLIGTLEVRQLEPR